MKFINVAECTPKAACNETDACQPVTEECVNGVCECQKNHDIEITAGLEILCTPGMLVKYE